MSRTIFTRLGSVKDVHHTNRDSEAGHVREHLRVCEKMTKRVSEFIFRMWRK